MDEKLYLNGITLVLEGPLSGRATSVLDRILRKIDNRENFEIVAVGDEIPVSTKVVVALTSYDNFTFRELTGSSIPIAKARGYRFEGETYPVIPTFSPWLVGKGKMNLIPVCIWDVQRAIEEIGKPAPEFPLEDLTLQPTPADFEEWCAEARSSSFLVHDIETPMSKFRDDDDIDEDPSYTINRFSLARDDFKAITAPWQEPFITMYQQLAAEKMDKVGWNSDSFDDPREAFNGVPMSGRRIDVQWLWHFLQPTLPRSLGHVTTYYDRVPAWKSLSGTDEELYSALDARETAKCFVGAKKALEARRI